MNAIDPKMRAKVKKALACANNTYDFDDIMNCLRQGTMQGHVVGDTWALTQVHDWPQRRSVNIMFVIGDMKDLPELEQKVTQWAKDNGADLITAMGRDGWQSMMHDGWKAVGTLYSKDI